MKKIWLICILGILMIIVAGCGGGGSGEGGDSPSPSSSASTNYAPSDIYGRSLKIAGNYNYKATDFNSNGTCDIPLGSLITLYNTPSYTYTKTGTNTATFYLTYKEKYKNGSSYSYLNYTLNLKFTFTSSDGGTFTGTIKCVTTGNVTAMNGTTTNSGGGAFNFY